MGVTGVRGEGIRMAKRRNSKKNGKALYIFRHTCYTIREEKIPHRHTDRR